MNRHNRRAAASRAKHAAALRFAYAKRKADQKDIRRSAFAQAYVRSFRRAYFAAMGGRPTKRPRSDREIIAAAHAKRIASLSATMREIVAAAMVGSASLSDLATMFGVMRRQPSEWIGSDGQTVTAHRVQAIEEAPPFVRPVLSPDVLASRAPRPPEELVGARHDSVHRESSKLRAAFPLPKRP